MSAIKAIRMHPGSKGKGFSLIELLIVVAVILIIAAIAIPNFMRSRIAADHASAVSNLRVINSAEMTYALQYGNGYTSTLSNLGPPEAGSQPSPSAAAVIDNVLASGAKGGYVFTYTPSAADGNGHYQQYTLNADPSRPGRTGDNYYFSDDTCVIRLNPLTIASSSDPPINSGTHSDSAIDAGTHSDSAIDAGTHSDSAINSGTHSDSPVNSDTRFEHGRSRTHDEAGESRGRRPHRGHRAR